MKYRGMCLFRFYVSLVLIEVRLGYIFFLDLSVSFPPFFFCLRQLVFAHLILYTYSTNNSLVFDFSKVVLALYVCHSR